MASRKRLVLLLRNANPFLGSKYLLSLLFLFSFQLLGIALRSDIPLALDLLPSFWKCLLNLPLDPDRDLKESDILTYNYLRRFSEVRPRCTCKWTSFHAWKENPNLYWTVMILKLFVFKIFVLTVEQEKECLDFNNGFNFLLLITLVNL